MAGDVLAVAFELDNAPAEDVFNIDLPDPHDLDFVVEQLEQPRDDPDFNPGFLAGLFDPADVLGRGVGDRDDGLVDPVSAHDLGQARSVTQDADPLDDAQVFLGVVIDETDDAQPEVGTLLELLDHDVPGVPGADQEHVFSDGLADVVEGPTVRPLVDQPADHAGAGRPDERQQELEGGDAEGHPEERVLRRQEQPQPEQHDGDREKGGRDEKDLPDGDVSPGDRIYGEQEKKQQPEDDEIGNKNSHLPEKITGRPALETDEIGRHGGRGKNQEIQDDLTDALDKPTDALSHAGRGLMPFKIFFRVSPTRSISPGARLLWNGRAIVLSEILSVTGKSPFRNPNSRR